MFYDSGLRLDEVCKLEKDNFKLDKNVILVTGKGKKQRYVPLGSLTKKYYNAYLNKMPLDPGHKIFLDRNLQPITGDAIQNIFYRIRKKTGVNVSAHKLRHNFATNYLLMQYDKNGHADIYQLMMILGHADVDTTRVYLHIAQQLYLGKETLSKLDSISNIMPSSD